MRALDELRAALRAAGGRWSAGANAFSGMSDRERLRHLTYTPGPDEMSLRRREAASRLARVHREHARDGAGSSCDLRGAGIVPPVRDDANAAMLATIECTLRRARGNPALEVDPPILDLAPGAVWLTKAGAALTLGVRGDAEPLVRVRAWRALHVADAMKSWLVNRGALLAVLGVHEDFYAYASGVYHHVLGALEGGHCVAVVGYDDTGDYWIAQNTWGRHWGEHGYFRIAYGERGIDASMWGVELQ